jgi:hypothetical protein
MAVGSVRNKIGGPVGPPGGWDEGLYESGKTDDDTPPPAGITCGDAVM